MHAPLVTLALFSSSALALQGLTNVHSFGAMLKRGEALAKRQGYYPTTELCDGTGTTCEEICGAGQAQCDSSDTFLHCHSSLDGTHCCTDGTGNACDAGFYCTNDGSGNTYCCAEDLTAEECAVDFGLTVSLIPDSATAEVPSATETIEVPEETTIESEIESFTESFTENFTETPSFTSEVPAETPVESPTLGLPTLTSATTTNTSPTGPAQSQFTGGAAKVMNTGVIIIAGAAGLAAW